MSRTRFVVVLVLLALAPLCSNLLAQKAAPPQPHVEMKANSGPVAISMGRQPGALVLQGDGVVVSFDSASGLLGSRVYRVPRDYFAADIATAPGDKSNIVVLTLNTRYAKDFTSWVLQLLPDRREIWTWMPQRGVYVGLAVDAANGHIYATNSSNNAIYRLEAGRDKAKPVKVAQVDEAERIGAVAIDSAGRRLFVADMTVGAVYVVPLDRGKATRIEVPAAEEIRALAWSAHAERLYIADSGQEAVLAVDPQRGGSPAFIRDKRFREPAGLMVSQDGVWLVDEGARAAFQINEGSQAVARVVAWNAK